MSALDVRFFALAVLLLGSAFFAGIEAALFTLGLYRVRRLKKNAPRSYEAAQRLLSEPMRLISTTLTGNEFANTAISVVGASLVYASFPQWANEPYSPFVATAFVLPFVLIFGEILPKTLGIKHPEKVVALGAVPLELFSKGIAPVRDFLHWVSRRLLFWIGSSEGAEQKVSEGVFRSMVDAGLEEGVVDRHEQTLIHNVFELDDVAVRQLMTPRADVSFLREDMDMAEVMQRLERDRYSRFPVLDQDEKRVVGVLYVKDLLSPVSVDRRSGIRRYIRPALRVSPDVTALDLFAHFRLHRTHFAAVVGAEEEILGVVTLDNVLERIFGRIRDERDVEEVASSTS